MNADFAPYKKLLARTREIALLTGAADLLGWDMETYMPPKAIGFRAEQMAHLSGMIHRKFTAAQVGGWIQACEDHGFAADSIEAANVREWRRAYDRETRLPAALVEEFQRARSHAREAWVEAKHKADFPRFLPHLEKIIALNQRMAECWGYEASPYDALLDAYEPGARAAELRALFAELSPAIVKLMGTAIARGHGAPARLPAGPYPAEKQQAFNREVAEAIGFDFTAGRIDPTEHPFCTSPGPGDCRLTTKYHEADFTQSLYSVLHEAGHGLYDQGLPAERHGTPCGTYASLGIHESQSRLWENHVGRSLAFWEHWHPRAAHYFPGLRRLPPEELAAAVNRVAPSPIRIEADQVSYDLHIILRFELEVELIEGRLAARDVPAAWNERFAQRFGLQLKNDAEGCLQDVHWSHGSLGYFPTYTLGNLNAAQLMRQAGKDLKGLPAALARGDYAPLRAWLQKAIHAHGHRYSPAELMSRATGETTQARHHLEALKRKFCR